MFLLEKYQIDVKGMNTVIINNDRLLGIPLSHLLLRKNSSVTIVSDPGMKDLDKIVKLADILVTCIGKYGMIQHEWIKENAIIFDAGYDYQKIDGKPTTVGDIPFDKV